MDFRSSVFKNIWLVDDDEDDHLVFESALNTVLPLATIKHIYSCSEFLSLLDKETPDLIFLDINLPYMDGKRCLKHIKEQKRFYRLPIAVYSASDYHVDINTMYGYGATLYIIKPLTEKNLLTLLKGVFSLNWDDPQAITDKQFVGNQFVPFSTE